MAIQMRRGLMKDFDPAKMLPGEWAVAIDEDTQNQIVWMCFKAGVVKRMGTYEDFHAQISEITGDIINQFKQELTAAQTQLQNKTETYIQGKVDDDWVPELEGLVEQAESSALSAYSSSVAAQESETNAEKSATAAATSEKNAQTAESGAKSAQTAAAESAEAAELSKQNAARSEANAEKWRKLSESYAHGGTGAREGENTDNSEYWYKQAERIAQGMNGIVYMGNKTFEQLSTAEKVVNYMYNVTDAFTSDETFNTPGVYYGAGNNVVWTGEGKWDVMAASAVNGIKGNNETYFHQGNYTVSPENLKLDTFAVATQRAMVSADDPLDVAFGKLAKYCADLKNVAFSGKYADMSGIGDLTAQTAVADTDNMLVGTDVAKKITFANVFNAIKSKLTGAVSTILTSILKGNMALVSDTSGKVAAHGTVTATELGYLHGATSNIQNQIGTLSDLGTTAKGNLVSAINELNTGISTLVSGNLNCYDAPQHGLGISYIVLGGVTLIRTFIDGQLIYDSIPNSRNTNGNYKITDVEIINPLKLKISMYIDGTIYSGYINLSST